MSDDVYVLSASFNSRSGSQMYVAAPYVVGGPIATIRLGEAEIFATENEAREQRIALNDSGWQIQPTTRQEIFKARLKG